MGEHHAARKAGEEYDVTINMVIHTICISSISVLMVESISARLDMLSGQSYMVALKPSQTAHIFFFSDSPWKNMMNTALCIEVFCMQKTSIH
jgi:hypothetical protein